MNLIKSRSIAGSASVLLDALRLGASLVVVYIHTVTMWFPELEHNPALPGNVSHAAVVVFFVLSGYVIAHTTTSNNRGPLHYAQARLSRLYSVVVPALVLTAIAEIIVSKTNLTISAEYTRGLSWPRYLITGGFLNEIWFVSAAPPMNIPLWSLGFEFWYYVIFGLWFYRRPTFKGLIWPLIGCLIAGPKVLLMMPLWLAGLLAYRLPRPRLRAGTAWALVGVGLGLAALMVAYLPPYPALIGFAPLFYGSQFVTDWGIGIFVGAAFWIMPDVIPAVTPSVWVGRFRQVADLTFPIYVVHNPLLLLWRALFTQRLYDTVQMTEALVTVLFVAVVAGLVMERQRPAWVRFFKWILNYVYAARPAIRVNQSAR